MNRTVVITGSSGLIGSALCAHLAPLYHVVGVDRRPPSEELGRAAPGVEWIVCDVAQRTPLLHRIERAVAPSGIPPLVVHLAAHYHLGRRWSSDYTATNIHGTLNVLACSARINAARLFFAGSIAALIPPPEGGYLFERDPAGQAIAYTRSKAIAERLLQQAAEAVSMTVLRLGGVFTDWCELPPLYSLIRLWGRPWHLGRIMPGRGCAGFPYIHRQDAVAGIAHAIGIHECLANYEILFVAPQGCTRQRDLFPLIYPRLHEGHQVRPLSIPAPLVWLLLIAQKWFCRLGRRIALEQPWMAHYIDRPLSVDTSYTRGRLGWAPDPDRSIFRCLPAILDRMQSAPQEYRQRNQERIMGHYQFRADETPIKH